MFNPISTINKRIKTKDDLQVILVALLIIFIIGVKIYMVTVGNRNLIKQTTQNYNIKDLGPLLLKRLLFK